VSQYSPGKINKKGAFFSFCAVLCLCVCVSRVCLGKRSLPRKRNPPTFVVAIHLALDYDLCPRQHSLDVRAMLDPSEAWSERWLRHIVDASLRERLGH
jgi:hypothetical protein